MRSKPLKQAWEWGCKCPSGVLWFCTSFPYWFCLIKNLRQPNQKCLFETGRECDEPMVINESSSMDPLDVVQILHSYNLNWNKVKFASNWNGSFRKFSINIFLIWASAGIEYRVVLPLGIEPLPTPTPPILGEADILYLELVPVIKRSGYSYLG